VNHHIVLLPSHWLILCFSTLGMRAAGYHAAERVMQLGVDYLRLRGRRHCGILVEYCFQQLTRSSSYLLRNWILAIFFNWCLHYLLSRYLFFSYDYCWSLAGLLYSKQPDHNSKSRENASELNSIMILINNIASNSTTAPTSVFVNPPRRFPWSPVDSTPVDWTR
jgi:hypothetical protein